jgi:hypothetical protein
MKSLIITKLAFLAFMAFPSWAFSQINHEQDIFKGLPEHLAVQVKQLDQFIARFNSNENPIGVRIDSKKVSEEDRANTIASLFDMDLLEKEAFRKKALKFIREVTGSGIGNLSFYDKEYYATIDCQILYKNKREDLTLTMALEGDRENGIKWVIVGANADFLQVETSKPSNDIIPPTNHEVDFVHLLEIFNVRKDLSNYVSERHGQNQLEVLNHMLKHEEIKMLNTTTPRYHFLQIPGWVFTVDFFNRSAKNSGWLISDLYEAKRSELLQYKIEKLSIIP